MPNIIPPAAVHTAKMEDLHVEIILTSPTYAVAKRIVYKVCSLWLSRASAFSYLSASLFALGLVYCSFPTRQL
jgi:hypothetical protein